MATFIRKDSWKLSAISTWEPTLLWYAKAVGEMSSRPANDPTSWRFQAGVHGYNKTTDPFVKSGAIPPASVLNRFWTKCQHGSFFLPWHRMYLGFFEEIVRAAVVKLGGPSDWALHIGTTATPRILTRELFPPRSVNKAKKLWDDKNVRVSFVPRGPSGEATETIAEHDPIKIGRISIYRA